MTKLEDKAARIVPDPANRRLYVGSTPTPLSASGAQLINNQAVASGSIIVGSGSYISPAGTTVTTGLVPVGWTVKAVWGATNGAADYSNTKGAVIFRYHKFYPP